MNKFNRISAPLMIFIFVKFFFLSLSNACDCKNNSQCKHPTPYCVRSIEILYGTTNIKETRQNDICSSEALKIGIFRNNHHVNNTLQQKSGVALFQYPICSQKELESAIWYIEQLKHLAFNCSDGLLNRMDPNKSEALCSDASLCDIPDTCFYRRQIYVDNGSQPIKWALEWKQNTSSCYELLSKSVNPQAKHNCSWGNEPTKTTTVPSTEAPIQTTSAGQQNVTSFSTQNQNTTTSQEKPTTTNPIISVKEQSVIGPSTKMWLIIGASLFLTSAVISTICVTKRKTIKQKILSYGSFLKSKSRTTEPNIEPQQQNQPENRANATPNNHKPKTIRRQMTYTETTIKNTYESLADSH